MKGSHTYGVRAFVVYNVQICYNYRRINIDVTSRRAMQIEVAMQNSALSVSLAMKHFTPQAAVAGAVFSIIHAVEDFLAKINKQIADRENVDVEVL